jgi:hypothetical protein
LFLVAIATFLAASVEPASASKKNFMAVLNSGQEVPVSLLSTAIGNAFMTFDSGTGELCYALTYVDLSSAETASHFHGPGAPGVDAPIVVAISGEPGAPSALGSPKQGCVTLDAAGAKALKQGLLYINVHSMNETGGEIRGQVIPVKGKN